MEADVVDLYPLRSHARDVGSERLMLHRYPTGEF
jgi:hypothetical protein